MTLSSVLVHAAVIAINEAIDQGVPEGTLAAMHNPNTMLVNLDASCAHQYHDTLYQAKGEKVANSRKRVRSFILDSVRWSHWKECWPGARYPSETIKGPNCPLVVD